MYVIFKLFARFKVNTLHAIIVNYIVALCVGILTSPVEVSLKTVYQSPWFFGAAGLGALFIFIFNIMAITAQRNGLSVVSVASKMSVVIPVIFGIILYDEGVGIIKITGILLALAAVYLASVKTENGLNMKNLLFPVLLFLGSGIIDTSLKYIETNYVDDNSISVFSASIFSFAAIFGLMFAALKKDLRFHWKSIIGGIVLGIPNYYSIVYLIKALASEGLESSMVFTVNNVAIVALSTLIGLFAFKEKMLLKNWIGVLLAVVGIFLVVY